MIPRTLADALPRVQHLVQRALLAQLGAEEVTRRLADLGCLASRPGATSSLPHIAELLEERDRLDARAERAWNEVVRLGGQVRDRELGVVDFPAEIAGRAVLLCWQLGEERLGSFHLVNEPCRLRRPLEALRGRARRG